MKVGYLGPEGTFSEEAGKAYAKKLNSKISMIPFSTFHDVLSAVDKREIDEAIVPLENSIEGTISTVVDMLAREVDLKINQEIVLTVYSYLLAKKGVKLKDITDVISHPQPIEQCKDYLTKHLKKARLHLAYSTSQAARQVAELPGPQVYAAIAPLAAAKMYGLNVVAKKISAKDNQTRFAVIAKRDHARTGHDKTSIVFTLQKDRPGGLHDVLAVFAVKNINLTKIESRPSKKALGDYYFFIDLQGHRDDKEVAQALKEIKFQVATFKLLGSYPAAKIK